LSYLDISIVKKIVAGGDFYLEEDLRAHGEAVRDDWFFIRALPIPTVQLDTPASGQ
jgi:hypothetical protein